MVRRSGETTGKLSSSGLSVSGGPTVPSVEIVVMSQLSPTRRGQTITSFARGCADRGRTAVAGVGDGDDAALVGAGAGAGVGSDPPRVSRTPAITPKATTIPLPSARARSRPDPPAEGGRGAA